MKKYFLLFTVLLLAFVLVFTLFYKEKEQSHQKNNLVKNNSTATILPKTKIAFLLSENTIKPADTSQILYHFDDKMIQINQKKLSAKEIVKRFMPPNRNYDDDNTIYIDMLKRFFYLDSLNSASDDPYIGVGQIANVEVRLVDTIPVSPAFTTVAWTIYYSTSDGSPDSEGWYYMISTYNKSRKLISTELIGKETTGGDSPLRGSCSLRGNLFRDGSFKLQETTIEEFGTKEEEKEEYYIETISKIFLGFIDKNGKIMKKEIKTKTVKSNHPPE